MTNRPACPALVRSARLAPSGWRPVLATAALALGLTLTQGAAFAQTVHVFEYTPPIEQLRSILIPESTGGASRKIVIPRPADLQGPSPVQQTAASAAAAPVPAPAQSAPAYQPPSSGPSQTPQAEPAPAVAAAPPPAAPVATPSQPVPMVAAGAPPRPADPAPERQEATGVVGFRINFALDSAAIPPAADPFLDELAELLRQEAHVALVVEGHTDAYGSDQYNLQLSQLRAQAVGLALIRRGVAAERLAIVGKGKREPLTANPYDPQNRRVQFVRVDGAGA